jgi:multiple sugar transport system permease protein
MEVHTQVTTHSVPKTIGLSRKMSWPRTEAFTAWLFVLPALVLLLIFLVVPFFIAVTLSFTDQRLVSGPLPTQFVGLRNYTRLMADNTFHRALLNNFIFAIVIVPVQTLLALLLALLINQKIRAVHLFRTIYFSPLVTMMTVVAIIWSFFYNPDQGAINLFLKVVSFGQLGDYVWLEDPKLALPAIMLMSIWQGTGFQMIIYQAGLQSIPESLYEAAYVDGAGRWRQFWDITLPQLRNASLFVVVATTIMAFKLYTQVEVMTQGGPANATTSIVWHMLNEGFRTLKVGYASAIAVIFFLIVVVISILQHIVLTREQNV